ncbi:alpha/beta fold hydrolase [Streptomyces wuyuanensis]|uniref:alpha/beta fold hydrolase n=1 Tax=Streptomyces wuyuanensis TaxID=1196353 RepID=UPI0036981720
MNTLPTLVLVHGAWHGPWCWKYLIDELPGLDVRTVALPSGSASLGNLYEDAEVVAKALASVGRPTVVVGHSYGGSPVTEAAATVTGVEKVIYLAALVQDVGESVLSMAGGNYPPYWDVHERPAESADQGYFEVAQPCEVLYSDVPPNLAEQAVAKLGRQSLASAMQPLTRAAWRELPTTYIVCEDDKAIPLSLQERMAARAQRIRRLRSGHSPFLSQPALLAGVLRAELTG